MEKKNNNSYHKQFANIEDEGKMKKKIAQKLNRFSSFIMKTSFIFIINEEKIAPVRDREIFSKDFIFIIAK